MERCIGNCAQCTLNVDKMACCMVQNLRLNIEIKSMLKEIIAKGKPDAFASLMEVTPSEEGGEAEPMAPGTDRVAISNIQ